MNFLIRMQQKKKFRESQMENRSFIRNWIIHLSHLQEPEQKMIRMFFW